MALARLFPVVSALLATTILATAAGAAPASAAQAVPTAAPPLREPARHEPLVQISEVVANSRNVGGVDAFEFVEVVNASDAPQDWAQLRLRYVYALVDLTTVAHVVMPVEGTAPVLDPGDSLVLWIVNDATDHLSVADFNDAYGTDLVEGRTLVRVRGAGLANGSMRGVEVAAASGISISRAYYNDTAAADAVKGSAVHYGPAVQAHEPQPRIAVATPSPGEVTTAQVGAAPVADAGAGDPPTVLSDRRSTFVPGRPVTLEAWARDDGLVRQVSLEISTDLEPDPVMHELVVDEVGLYGFELTAAHTAGRSSITYRFIVSDGHTTVSSDPITLARAGDTAPVRLRAIDAWDAQNRQDVESVRVGTLSVREPLTGSQVVAGDVQLVTAAQGAAAPQLTVDGVALETHPELEHEPVFAFDATLTDAYFRNGVMIGDELLTVFDRGYYSERRTVQTMVPLERVNPGEPFTLRVYSGTKARTAVDPDEANDDFEISGLRLVLPDGTELAPEEHPDRQRPFAVGDGSRSEDWIEATFTVPEHHFTARAATWDSTTVPDGAHEVTAIAHGQRASAVLEVDNTAPALEPTIAPHTQVRGEARLDVSARDGAAGLDRVDATLDGRAVTLPLTVSSLTDAPGEHVAVVTASDERGNATTLEIPFSIPRETPALELAEDGAAATVTDASGDLTEVTFARGRSLDLGSEVTVRTGEVAAADAPVASREDGRALVDEDLEVMRAADGSTFSSPAAEGQPYLLLETQVPHGAQSGSDVRVRWEGVTEPNARVVLSVLDPVTGAWVEQDSTVAASDGAVGLDAEVPASTYANDGVVTALVQHGAGYAGAERSPRQDLESPHHPEDTPRGEYDFTIAWESDTQYYNSRDEIHDRQRSIHDYLLDQRDEVNLQYLIHTGDIVDWSAGDTQWQRAEPAYAALDAAGLPYGVLAGNHDVDQQTNDYAQFSRWYGAHRYADNPWWGGDHQDNRGHYDLITAGGIDFLFLYMGWGAGEEQLRWMNEVLAAHPERIALVNLHEYMLTTGGLGLTPQRIHDEVIATNPNVRLVLSGHYHDAFTRIDGFDDDGDGVEDRQVTSMLFDYQDLPNGGEGYLRLLHFDNESSTITVRTYSDHLRDYDAVHPSLAAEHQEFTIPYAQAGILPAVAVLRTDALRVDLLGDEVLAAFSDVPAGTTVSAGTTADAGTPSVAGGWYVRAVDPYGAVATSDVRAH